MENQKKTNQDRNQKEAEHYRESAEKHLSEVKSEWRTLGKTGIFVLAAIGALALLGLAWFVSNNRVNSGTAAVTAKHDIIRLASKGKRQQAEENKLHLNEGTEKTYSDGTYYYTEDGEIALYLSNDYTVFPGATGKIEFYVIPTSDGAQKVTLQVELAGYKEVAENQVQPINDEVWKTLLKGHILLFDDRNLTDGFYSNWLFNESTSQNEITVELQEDAKADTPYPVTFYWIWPARYENLISHRQNQNDLYNEGSEEFKTKFSPFIEDQADTTYSSEIPTTTYRYSSIFLSKKEEWPLSSEISRTNAYNLADEYIGTNADYLYVTIRTDS